MRTNIITSARVTKGTASDNPFFEELARETAERFRMREICADAGYLSKRNCSVAEELGADPYILPKKNTRIWEMQRYRGTEAWRKMIKLWRDHQPTFLDHYHQRSNVESTFSMMKRKFLPYVRSKSDTAQVNEILCKVICHNVAVLCQAMFELDIDLDFENHRS